MEGNRSNPLIKRILQSYQATAQDTLRGPNGGPTRDPHLSSASVRCVDYQTGHCSYDEIDGVTVTDLVDTDVKMVSKTENLRQILGQRPMFLPIDQSTGALTETELEGQRISCFDIEGEKRLCLPQLINCILSYFTLSQINAAYDELRIFNSLCSGVQLNLLKQHNVLPPGAASCGLITKSNAARLCSHLLRRPATVATRDVPKFAEDGFGVSHRCFGKGRGFFVKSRYLSASSPAIRCCDCFGMLTPAEFVCHSHRALENRVCHWGFDSSRWRCYVRLSKDQIITEALEREFEEMKALYIDDDDDDKVHHLKRSPSFVSNEVNRTDNTTRNQDGAGQLCSFSSATLKDEDLLSRRFTFNPASVQTPDFQSGREASFSRSDECKSFAPNVSLVPDGVCEKRLQPDLDCEEDKRPSKCPKIEIDLATDDHLSKETMRELSQLFKEEVSLFQDVLNQKEPLSTQMRKKVFDKYMLFQKRFQATVDRLVHREKKLQEDLFRAQRQVSDIMDEFASTREAHDQRLSRRRLELQGSVKSSSDENHLLKVEVEALTNARKRSDYGLMKAKYKAQIELFRRKWLSVEQSNKELIPKCAELKKYLNECYKSAHLVDTSDHHIVTTI